MIARASQLFLPTLRDAPGDAEAVNHKLLVRGGFVRQVSGGIWTFLPLGWRVHRKIEQIIREEMDAIGCQEMLMPVLTPLELWQATGRDFIPELFRLKDRKGADYVLPLTHEETVTFHARELQSYRQLPQMLYHFAIKERDEPRPRAGLIRLREFIMKDAYSFDRDEAGLAKNFELQRGAYHRIFERLGLRVHGVEAESGMMGGSGSFDFLAPAGAGENTLVTCENGDFAADLEVARGIPRAPEFPETLGAPTEVETPDVKTCEALAAFLGIDVAATSKAMPVTADDGTVVLALVRGDDRIEPAKLDAALGRPARPSTDEEIRAAFGASGGSLGPVGFEGEVVADETLREGQFVAGANRDGWHLRGVEAGRDFEAALRRPPPADGGRRLPELRRAPVVRDGDRGRSHLQARDAVLGAARRDLPRRGRAGAPARDGQLRDRPGAGDGGARRAEPRRAGDHLARLGGAVRRACRVSCSGAEEIGQAAAEAFSAAGKDVLLDDRDLRPGEKFADADLIGIPIRVTAGKKSLEDGAVDVRRRETGEERRVKVADLGKED